MVKDKGTFTAVSKHYMKYTRNGHEDLGSLTLA